MGAVSAGKDEVREGGLAEQNSHMLYENKEVSNGVVLMGQDLGPSGEDEPKGNGSSVNFENGPSPLKGLCMNDSLQVSQPQGPIIRWERFLPVRSLKVLLVENDDSTRHVVSALLRNCSYEVTAVADGLQAWKVLEDQSIHTDIVLTEVVIPFLSGIALLCKIINHKSLKNIPVIMMSSHDSMGLVFKCLSKGAVDFLAKPIRKNELKNLWQHVWRRCHSSSASGSESGTHTKKAAKSKSNDESENNTSSSDEQDNGSNRVVNRDGSDNGSGTQSSWTKRITDVDSRQPMSPLDQLAAPDSTCAQVVHIEPGANSSRWVCVAETKEYLEQVEHDSRCEFEPQKLSTHATSKRKDKLPETDSNPLENRQQNSNPVQNEISTVANSTRKNAARGCTGIVNGLDAISHSKDKENCNSVEIPSLELTLKSTRVDGGPSGPDEHNILRHSDLSAFSKYNTALSANQIGTGNVGSCSPLGNSSAAVKTETVHNYLSGSSSTPPDQQSNGNSNNMVSKKSMLAKLEGINGKPDAVSAFKSSAFQPLSNPVCSSQPLTSGVLEDDVMVTTQKQPTGQHNQIQVQHHHHHHHHHHYHHHVRRVQQSEQQQDCDVVSMKTMAAIAPQCGSSNAIAGPTDGNSGNASGNGSVSGSNQGSNGQNGASTALNTGVNKMESDNGAAGNNDSGGKISRNGADEERVAHREAALTKFRQKRKERCFEKRVRYQSRKRLAEQRPRIRGQFVRQIMPDSRSGKDDNQSSDLVSEDNSCD